MNTDNNTRKKIKLLAVVGPTASGKSALALRLAKKCGGAIICCDSMQIYRGMDIGTAKPTVEERQMIPHSMFDIQEPGQPYSCADYARDAAREIARIAADGMLPILCGGTGLYLDSLLTPRSYDVSPGRTQIRAELEMTAALPDGKQKLHRMLEDADPISAAAIHENNVRRVIRALEIYRETGIPKSEHDRNSQIGAVDSQYDATVICLHYPNRALLRRRIELRVNDMYEAGLADEVKRLDSAGAFAPTSDGSPSTAGQAIGYKELLPLLREGKDPLAAKEDIVTATCRYAKRQMTWFAAKTYINRIDILSEDDDVLGAALKILDKAGIAYDR